MEKKDSIFSGLTPSVRAFRDQQPPLPAPAPAAPAPARPEKDPRVDGLEAAVKALQAEIAVLKQLAARPQPPAPPPQVSKAEMGAVKTEMETVKTDMQTVKSTIPDILSSFEVIKRKLSGYAEEFSTIETECRKSLGEMQGYAKNLDQKLVAERFDEHLKDSVSRLNVKFADMERAIHSGLSDLSSRLMSDEVLNRKIFAEAEERLMKGLGPEMQAITGQLNVLTSKVTWLMDEYSIVMERKMRALEVKYSAFEIISARMDALSEALRSGNDSGGEKRPQP